MPVVVLSTQVSAGRRCLSLTFRPRDSGVVAILISEPNLNTRSAALLGNLTSSIPGRGGWICATEGHFDVAEGDLPRREPCDTQDPELKSTFTSALQTLPPPLSRAAKEMIERIPVHLAQYRSEYEPCAPWSGSLGLSSRRLQ